MCVVALLTMYIYYTFNLPNLPYTILLRKDVMKTVYGLAKLTLPKVLTDFY